MRYDNSDSLSECQRTDYHTDIRPAVLQSCTLPYRIPVLAFSGWVAGLPCPGKKWFLLNAASGAYYYQLIQMLQEEANRGSLRSSYNQSKSEMPSFFVVFFFLLFLFYFFL